MTNTTVTILAELQSAGIITADHHTRALAHPYSYELSGKSSLADHLLWMLEHEIIDLEVLGKAEENVQANCKGEECERLLSAVKETFRWGINAYHKACFLRLFRAGWITQVEYDRALAAMGPDDIVISGPGGLLEWLIGHGIIDKTRVAEIRAKGNPEGDIEKAQMLKDVARVFDRQVLWSGHGRIFVVITLVVASVVTWEIFRPASAPQCQNTRTGDAIRELFTGSTTMDFMKPDAVTDAPTVESISEVGYASGPRVRACKAVVQVSDRQVPFAFTIAPTEDDEGFAIRGAQPAILEARFGNIDADGDYGNNADPLGRAEVEQAFRAGVDSMYGGLGTAPGGNWKRQRDMLNEIHRKLGQAYEDPDRAREIAEVEPLGPCRPVQADKVYSCRLLVERNDRLLAALNDGGSVVLDGHFTFERDGPMGQFHTTDALPGELAKATMAAQSAQKQAVQAGQ